MIGRIYKIVSSQSEECYIGSTLNTLTHRFYRHKCHYKEWKNGNGNRTAANSFLLFKKYGVETCKILLIKEYEVVDREHLEAYETLWINKTKNKVNKMCPFSLSNYGEHKKKYDANYYQQNKERIKANVKKIC
jgi:hypothetical protein